jgi:hypothetical protein
MPWQKDFAIGISLTINAVAEKGPLIFARREMPSSFHHLQWRWAWTQLPLSWPRPLASGGPLCHPECVFLSGDGDCHQVLGTPGLRFLRSVEDDSASEPLAWQQCVIFNDGALENRQIVLTFSLDRVQICRCLRAGRLLRKLCAVRIVGCS